MTGAPIRVLIADDQRVVRDGLELLVGLIDGVEIVATVADGLDAVARAASERPDVVLMDLRMPGLDGTEATRRIRAQLPGTSVLVLTTYADDQSLFGALAAGARGYLTKDASAEEIERAIRALAAGRTHLDAEVQERLVAAALAAAPHPPDPGGPAPPAHPAHAADPPYPAHPSDPSGTRPDSLTEREAEVLRLIAGGLSNGEIAAALVVSPATVKTHVNRIFYKTGSRDRAQAVRYAYRRGLA